MKSIEARYKEAEENYKYGDAASLIKFLHAVNGGKFSRGTIRRWFNKLVSKDDYEPRDKQKLIEYAFKITEDDQIRG